MSLLIGLTSDNKSLENLSILSSSLDEVQESIIFSNVCSKIENEKLLERLNCLIFSILNNNEELFLFLNVRQYDSNNNKVVIVLVDFNNSSFELFQNDIIEYLDESFNDKLTASDIDWKHKCVNYIPRIVKNYEIILPELIFAAIQDYNMSFQHISKDDIADLQRFIANLRINGSNDKENGKVTFNKGVIENVGNSIKASVKNTSNACASLSDKLINEDDPINMKMLINDFILDVNKDINVARRLLNRAVGDYYLNYHLYRFLSSSDKCQILLYQLKLIDDISEKEEAVLNLTMKLI